MEDINEGFNTNGPEYFIGSTVTCERGNHQYELIDGQQRLTTLFVCLCAFKKLLNKLGEDVSDIQNMLFSNIKRSGVRSCNITLISRCHS